MANKGSVIHSLIRQFTWCCDRSVWPACMHKTVVIYNLTFGHWPSCIYDACSTTTEWPYFVYLVDRYNYWIFRQMLHSLNFFSTKCLVFHIVIIFQYSRFTYRVHQNFSVQLQGLRVKYRRWSSVMLQGHTEDDDIRTVHQILGNENIFATFVQKWFLSDVI